MTESKNKKRLKPEHKLFVVQCLARFMTPSEVVEAVRENCGVEITRQSIEGYDPAKAAGRALDEELKLVFYRTRKKFISEFLNVDIAHRAFRLAELSKLYHAAAAKGKDVMAAGFLEQAAKEVGGIYINRVDVRVMDRKATLAELLGVGADQLPE
jgi:hypothetical protein